MSQIARHRRVGAVEKSSPINTLCLTIGIGTPFARLQRRQADGDPADQERNRR
jgi:hypothetical protein